MDERTFAAVRDAFEQYSLLVFPDQHLDGADQVAFSARFGDLEVALTRLGDDETGRHIARLSNANPDGSFRAPDDRQMLFDKGNQLWHTDSTYKDRTAIASMSV